MQRVRAIHYYLMLLMAAFPFFFPYPVSYIMAAWGASCLVLIIAAFKSIRRQQWMLFLFASLPFFLPAVYALFHPNPAAVNWMQRMHSLWVFPVGLLLTPVSFTDKQFRTIGRAFVAGVAGTLLYAIAMIVLYGYHQDYDAVHDFTYRFRSEFNAYTKVHPGYATAYAILGIFFMLEEGVSGSLKPWKAISAGLVLLTLCGLLMARIPLLALVTALPVWMLRRRDVKNRKRLKWIVGLASGLMLVAVLVAGASRWKEIFTFRNADFSMADENTLLVRRGIYHCAGELLQEHACTGAGPDHLQQELNRCYYQYPTAVYQRHNMNTHNQYLDYWLSYGITGLLVLLTVLLVPFYLAWKKKDALYLVFLWTMLLCLLTENMLSRFNGLVFYAFFNSLFLARMFAPQISSGASAEKNL